MLDYSTDAPPSGSHVWQKVRHPARRRTSIALKELKESRIWLRFARRLAPDPAVDALWRESGELVRMLGASVATALRARSSH